MTTRSVLAFGVFLLTLVIPLSIIIGSQQVSISTTLDAIFAFESTNNTHLLVHHLRIPRTFVTLCCGSGLAMAGLLLHSITRNPLADAGLLGVNAGASLFIVLAIALTGFASVSLQMVAGFCGVFVCALLVISVGSLGIQGSSRLVIAGFAFSAVFLAFTQLIVVTSDLSVFEQFRHWAVGTTAGRSYDVLWPLLCFTLLGFLLAVLLAASLDAMVLGEQLSFALGVKVRTIWFLCLIAITLLAGSATAAAGPIAFIGLSVPHFARRLMGSAHYPQLLFCTVFGGLVLLIADILGRLIIWPSEVSTGIMMALLGGPFFIYLVRRPGQVSL
ncbi:iron ABC transporter permease [Leucothrix sargassi]|nr:iron ABC transporter permease [Leucothrix sargassi]